MATLKQQSKSSHLWKKQVRKFYNNKLAMFGLICVVFIMLTAVMAPMLTDYSPTEVNFGSTTLPPDGEHLFGTDKLGRDVFARVLYGGQISILVGMVGAISSSVIGMILGSIAGYYGGKVDQFLIRVSEMFQTFPQMILILLMVAIAGQGLQNLLIIFCLTGWMTTFRMVRNEFMSLREETYVQVCEAFGMSKSTIMFKQILPNVISPIIVATTVNVAGFILMEAGLSFIGLGVPAAIPTWGNILNAAKSIDVVSDYWWLWLIPGGVITLFVLAINFLGDGLRDVLDPKQQ